MRHALARLLLAALSAVALFAGCDVMQTGNEQVLEFEYVTSDRLIPVAFSTPLAAGLKVDVKVYVAGGTRTPAAVSLAQPKDQAVARVTATRTNTFTLDGRSAGATTIDIVSAAGNDSFDLTVNNINKVDLTYPGAVLAPASPPVRVAQGGTAHFGFTLKGANGQLLIGYGALPVTLAPAASAVEVVGTSTGQLAVRFDTLGVVTLTPLNSAALEVTVVPVSDITALTLSAGSGDAGAPPPAIIVGSTTAVIARAHNDLAEPILGLTGVLTVATTTPTICEVTPSSLLGDAAFTVAGLGRGNCAISATLGALSAEATVEIQ